MKNLRHLLDFRREEIPVVTLLFSFFFSAIAVFQILKPLKNGLFIEHFGANVELYAKLLNIVAAACAVVAFSWLYDRLPRQRVVYALCAFFIAGFLWLRFALISPGEVSIWSMYILGDLVSTLMVASFFAYLTDISTADQAKRLFGLIGAGGVLGGWAGVTFAKVLLKSIHMEGLLLLAAGLMLVPMAATAFTERSIRRDGAFRAQLRAVEAEPRQSGWGAAMEGARLVLRSPYLAAIMGIMACYEIASQLMDYQFKHSVELLEGVEATQGFMTNVYFYANVLSVVMQIFLVSVILRRFGATAALLIMPVAVMVSSLGFLAVPTMYVASLLVISDNGLNYSLQQTTRESLYVVTTPEEKYKARAFTNMFVQRAAKGVSIAGSLGLIALKVDSRYFSLITVAAMAVMIGCSIYAGRRFERLAAAEAPERKAA